MLYMTFCTSIYMFWYIKEYCPFYDNHDHYETYEKENVPNLYIVWFDWTVYWSADLVRSLFCNAIGEKICMAVWLCMTVGGGILFKKMKCTPCLLF